MQKEYTMLLSYDDACFDSKFSDLSFRKQPNSSTPKSSKKSSSKPKVDNDDFSTSSPCSPTSTASSQDVKFQGTEYVYFTCT